MHLQMQHFAVSALNFGAPYCPGLPSMNSFFVASDTSSACRGSFWMVRVEHEPPVMEFPLLELHFQQAVQSSLPLGAIPIRQYRNHWPSRRIMEYPSGSQSLKLSGCVPRQAADVDTFALEVQPSEHKSQAVPSGQGRWRLNVT